MTNMDKKIKELNDKLGRKTGVDFKESGKVIAKEVYDNKPLFCGLLSFGLLFINSGIITSVVGGVVSYYLYKKLFGGK